LKKADTIADSWRFRLMERKLFTACFLTIALGYIGLFLNDIRQQDTWGDRDFLPLLVFGISLLLIHVWLVLFRVKADPTFLGTVVFLGGFGILAQHRMGLFDLEHPWRLGHFAYPIGIVLMLVTSILFRGSRIKALKHLGWLAGLLSLLTLVGLLLTGTRYRGAYYASGQITPTEILKLLMVLFVASYMAGREKNIRKTLEGGGGTSITLMMFPVYLVFGLLMGLLILQRDLGMMMLLAMMLCLVLFFVTGQWRYVMVSLCGLITAGWLAGQWLTHARIRIQTWLDPFEDPTGAGWQILQGLSGMFAGGMLGAGFGMGNPERIPIAESDFIYAVIGEELGFAGCLVLVTFYLIFFHQSYRIAFHCKDLFGSILAAGLASIWACQTLLNLGGVTKAIPMTGIPLPLVSHGGSNLVTVFIGLGLMLSLSESGGHYPQAKKADGKKSSPRR
jgi:cell division protein FtsW (lipid II flippase)